MSQRDPFDAPSAPDAVAARTALRRRLLADRMAFAASPAHAIAQADLQAALAPVLEQLEPECLGLYWPVRGEFSAGVLPFSPIGPAHTPRALPFARRAPQPSMHYRSWAGPGAAVRDEFDLPASDGPEVVPDVVLVPCVGFTAAGLRLGYGAGFFDRYLAAHPGVTAIGIAWSAAQLDESVLPAEPHDRPLDLIVTERGVLGA